MLNPVPGPQTLKDDPVPGHLGRDPLIIDDEDDEMTQQPSDQISIPNAKYQVVQAPQTFAGSMPKENRQPSLSPVTASRAACKCVALNDQVASPGESRRMAAVRLSTNGRLISKRERESKRPCAIAESTQRLEKSRPIQYCDREPPRMFAMVRHIPPVTPTWNESCFNVGKCRRCPQIHGECASPGTGVHVPGWRPKGQHPIGPPLSGRSGV